MSESTTLTVRLSVETKAQLARLAEHVQRRQGALCVEAITAYVTDQLAIIEAVERGRRDVRAGRVVANDEAFRQLQAVIDATQT